MKTRIVFNQYLDEIFLQFCLARPKGFQTFKMTDASEAKQKVAKYKEAWEPIEATVVEAIEQKLGKKSPYSLVDVSIVRAVHRSYSNPIVFPTYFTVDRFICSLIHELIHKAGYASSEKLKKDFSGEIPEARNHIVVHALLKYIFLDILNRPDLLEQNVGSSRAHSTSTYSRAWEIVEEKGYKYILDEYLKK